jgi:hypothetical protein
MSAALYNRGPKLKGKFDIQESLTYVRIARAMLKNLLHSLSKTVNALETFVADHASTFQDQGGSEGSSWTTISELVEELKRLRTTIEAMGVRFDDLIKDVSILSNRSHICKAARLINSLAGSSNSPLHTELSKSGTDNVNWPLTTKTYRQ